jgi:hypothetical protein
MTQHLLAYEAGAGNSAGTNTPPAFRVAEKLRRPLSTLLGAAAFRALLARALALAKARVPGLGGLQVKPDGALEGLIDDRTPEAGAPVIAQLLSLLGLFIGEDITLRLVVDIWPELSPFDVEPYGESGNDPTR